MKDYSKKITMMEAFELVRKYSNVQNDIKAFDTGFNYVYSISLAGNGRKFIIMQPTHLRAFYTDYTVLFTDDPWTYDGFNSCWELQTKHNFLTGGRK